KGSSPGPVPYNQPESLWVAYPSLTYYGAKIYPSGLALAYPPVPPTGILVDDGGANFEELPDQCWNDIAVGGTTGGVMRYSRARTSSPNCAAHWKLPVGANDGLYALYVRIPPVRATNEG